MPPPGSRPLTRCQDSATRRFEPETEPPFSSDRSQTGATPGFVSPVRLRQIRPGSSIQGSWGHPPIHSGRNRGHPSVPLRLPKQCHPSVRVGSEPKQCHPSVRRAAKLVPPPDASLGPPPNPGGGSGVVAAGLSAQPCSRSPGPIGTTLQPTGQSVPPPIHQPACQDGATRQFVSGRVRQEVRNSATRQFRAPRRTESVAKMVPPARKPTGATRRFVSSRVREEARNRARNRATRQFGSIIRPTGATR